MKWNCSTHAYKICQDYSPQVCRNIWMGIMIGLTSSSSSIEWILSKTYDSGWKLSSSKSSSSRRWGRFLSRKLWLLRHEFGQLYVTMSSAEGSKDDVGIVNNIHKCQYVSYVGTSFVFFLIDSPQLMLGLHNHSKLMQFHVSLLASPNQRCHLSVSKYT
jgi:hypothetical protein